MELVFLFIQYPLMIIAQVAYLIYSIMKRKEKNWIGLFLFNIFAVVFSVVLSIYYSKTADRSLILLLEYLICIFMILIHLLIFFITICIKIVIFENNLKKQNKNYVNPFCLILATSFIFSGILTSGYEFLANINTAETQGKVVRIETSKWIPNTENVIIEYEVDGQKYEDEITKENQKVGDVINIYYSKNNNEYEITYKVNTKAIYIPAYIMGLLIIAFRFKDSINTKENRQIDVKKKEDNKNEKK